MNCRDASISLQLAEDGEVTRDEREALVAHLEACLDCRRLAAWLEVVSESYPAAPLLDDDFANDVLRCLSPGADKVIEEAPVRVSSSKTRQSTVKQASWLRRIGALVFRGAGRQTAPKKGPGWSRRAAGAAWTMVSRRRSPKALPAPEPSWSAGMADSLLFGFRSIGPAMAPAMAGPSYATGWLRGAGSNLRRRTRSGR